MLIAKQRQAVSNVKCYESFFTFINTHPKCTKYKTKLTYFFTDKHIVLQQETRTDKRNAPEIDLVHAVNTSRGKLRAFQQGLNFYPIKVDYFTVERTFFFLNVNI